MSEVKPCVNNKCSGYDKDNDEKKNCCRFFSYHLHHCEDYTPETIDITVINKQPTDTYTIKLLSLIERIIEIEKKLSNILEYQKIMHEKLMALQAEKPPVISQWIPGTHSDYGTIEGVK